MSRIDEIKSRSHELMTGTLHGNIPIKTTMQLVDDINYLMSMVLSHIMDKHGPFCVKCGRPRSAWRPGDECQPKKPEEEKDQTEL